MTSWHPVDDHNQEEEVLDDKWSNTHGGANDLSQQPSLSNWGTWSSSSAAAQRTKRTKRCIAVCVALVVLLIVVCATVIAIAVKVGKDNSDSNNNSESNSKALRSLTTACKSTLYPKVCYDSLSNMTNSSSTSLDFVKYAIAAARDSVIEELTVLQIIYVNSSVVASTQLKAVAYDCIMSLQDSLDSLDQTGDAMKSLSVTNLDSDLADLQTWMSAALTNQESCVDGLKDLGSTSSPVVAFLKQGNESTMLLSNALAFVASLKYIGGDLPALPAHRRLLTLEETSMEHFQRRLLQSVASTPNVIVSLDGTGNYMRIQEAVNHFVQGKNSTTTQYVIRIKAGKYLETVNIPKTATNLVLEGDGVGETIISGSLSVIGSNVTTSTSATLTVQAKNFLGRDFTVENTAGAVTQQAVALRVSGDLSAFQRCEILGHQDSLYVHTNRQFYVNCTIVGTVDFIFGNAAVVFQASQILATTGMLGQQNTYTASGRTDPNQNTGISFQRCTFDGTPSLRKAASGTYLTYLGRPWKPYARVVVMQSVESSVLDPEGWLDWNGQVYSTAYFAEYLNKGPGSGTSHRVPWSNQIMNVSKAMKFTVAAFVQGGSWLPESNFTYQKSL